MDICGNLVFTVDTKINDVSKCEKVENIAFEQIYHYLRARGYSDSTYHITDHPGVIKFTVYARLHEGETLVKELAEIYPNYIFSGVQ